MGSDVKASRSACVVTCVASAAAVGLLRRKKQQEAMRPMIRPPTTHPMAMPTTEPMEMLVDLPLKLGVAVGGRREAVVVALLGGFGPDVVKYE